MESMLIELGKAEIELWLSDDKTINLSICVEGENEYASEDKEISRETLKSYIDKFQLFYDSTNN